MHSMARSSARDYDQGVHCSNGKDSPLSSTGCAVCGNVRSRRDVEVVLLRPEHHQGDSFIGVCGSISEPSSSLACSISICGRPDIHQ